MKAIDFLWLIALVACSEPRPAPGSGAAGGAGGATAGAPPSGSSGDGGAASAPTAGRGATAGAAAAGAAGTPSAVAGASGTQAGGMAGDGPVGLEPWPGVGDVVSVDEAEQFGQNFSGLTYEPPVAGAPGVLWGVSNLPGKLYRLLRAGPSSFVADSDDGWSSGKPLHYPDGSGEPDAEGVTFTTSAAEGLYVVAEHDNTAASISRLSVLRYDASSASAALDATHEWDLTAALPSFGANLGLEAITWISDTYLTAKGFFDEAKGRTYEPTDYPSHAGGLFFVGVEQTGHIYGFALNHQDGSFELLTTLKAPLAGVMGLEHDRDAGYLWAYCDEVCGNQAALFDVDTRAASTSLGRFTLLRHWERPSGLPDAGHEGIAFAPDSECSAGSKPFFWADDDDTAGQALRQGDVRCGAL